MTAPAPRKRSSPGTNALLVIVTVLVGIVAAEATVRMLNSQPLLAFPLPDPVPWNDVKPADFDAVPVSTSVDKSWFDIPPKPLPNRGRPPTGWQDTYNKLRARPSEGNPFRPVDALKAWNSARLGQLCASGFLAQAPDRLYAYDPPDGRPLPPYRYLPNVTYPNGLVTNQIGWRGPPIDVPRGRHTVRIVFVGASTVMENHESPYSFPEYTGHWLNIWAKARNLDVSFEVLNAARDGIASHDIAEVIRTEVMLLRPNLVVYSEGANQFDLKPLVERMPDAKPQRPGSGGILVPPWLREAARYSALTARVQFALGYVGSDLDGGEWPKPDYRLIWPDHLDEQDPDLSYPNLPVNLTLIQHDLDRIRADLSTIDSDFALASFFWFVRDGMVVDASHRLSIINQLNISLFPFRYRDIERLAKFQNRVFAKYARTHGLTFVDLAGQTPFSASLFADAIHAAPSGSRIRGWIAFQQLLPMIEKHLADKSWPTLRDPATTLPTFAPREIAVPCK